MFITVPPANLDARFHGHDGSELIAKRSLLPLTDLNFPRHDGDHLIFFRIAHHADRVFALLYGFDVFLKHFSQQDHAFIRHAEVLAAAVEDRPLAFLGAAVLVTAGDSAGLFVPTVFSQNAVAQAFS